MRLATGALAAALVWAVPASAGEVLITGTAEIVDGDMLDLGPVRIRLHGIDAPEAGQQCGDAVGGTWPCGDEAASRLAELAEGKQLDCEALDRDAYGRIIATCRVGDLDINATMVDEGMAWAFVRFSKDYVAFEAAAHADGIGIWQGEAEAPWDYRASKWEWSVETAPDGCPIKGNISRDGEMIYRMPWSPGYERTKINEAGGERWFCDEAQAAAAGWRPARWR